MPQWRKLHTKITESFDVNEMPDDFTRLMWTLMPLALDKEGRGVWNPGWVKSKLMPLRTDVSLEQVQEALKWFEKRGMVRSYSVEGRAYFHVPSFGDYQSTRKEAESDYPSPPEQVKSHGGASPDQGQSEDGASPDQGQSEYRVGRPQIKTRQDEDKDGDEDRDEDRDGDKEKDATVAAIFKAYESEIGPLTPSVADQVGDAIDDERYPDHWLTEAIGIAAAANKRSWRYVQGILRNWHTEGYDGGEARSGDQNRGNGQASALDKALAEAEEEDE